MGKLCMWLRIGPSLLHSLRCCGLNTAALASTSSKLLQQCRGQTVLLQVAWKKKSTLVVVVNHWQLVTRMNRFRATNSRHRTTCMPRSPSHRISKITEH